MGWIRNKIDRLRYLWRAALEENATPKKFAMSVALGALVSAAPVPPVAGLRSFTAIGVAWVAKCNRLTAWLASHIVIFPLWVLFSVWEVRIGSWILRRPPPVWAYTAQENAKIAGHALAAWWIGGLLVAPLVAAISYAVAYPIAKRYRDRKERAARELAIEATPDPRTSRP